MDIVFVVGAMFLTGVVQPIGYAKTIRVQSTKGRDLMPCCSLFCKTINSASGVSKINYTMFDRESAINEFDFIQHTGVALKQSIPDVHNQTFEGRMRPFRNQWRCALLRVEDKLPMTKAIKRLAWSFIIEASNYLMTSKTKPYLPKQLLFWENDIRGSKVSTPPQFHTPCEFGAYVIVHRRVETDKSTMRRQVAIVLGLENTSRAVLVRFSDSNKLFPRHAYRIVSDAIGQDLWNRAKTHVDFVIDTDEQLDADQEVRSWKLTHDVEPLNQEEQHELVEFDDTDQPPPDAQNELDQLQDAEMQGELVNEAQTQEEVEVEDVLNQGELNINQTPMLRRSSRATKSTQKQDFVYEGDAEFIQSLRIKSMLYDAKDSGLTEPIHKTLEQLMSMADQISQEDTYERDSKLNSEKGKDASVKLELFRVWEKYGAFNPVKLSQQQKQRKITIKSRLFSIVKENENTGEFIKNKSRIVARGDQREFKPTDTLETFSPTFAFQTFLIILNIILFLKFSWCIVDVELAYLYAPMPKEVYMSLSKNVAKHMLEIDPTVAEFINEDGTIDVILIKAKTPEYIFILQKIFKYGHIHTHIPVFRKYSKIPNF
jgi:hypothetical protein